MHSVNYNSKERDVRLAMKANAIRMQRNVKQMLRAVRANHRILVAIERIHAMAGII